MYSFNILSVHHIPHMLWKMGRTGPGASNVIYQSKKRRAAELNTLRLKLIHDRGTYDRC